MAARIQLKSGQLSCAVCIVRALRPVFSPPGLLLLVIYVCIVAPKVCKSPNSLSVMFQRKRPSALFGSSSLVSWPREEVDFSLPLASVLYFLYQQHPPLYGQGDEAVPYVDWMAYHYLLYSSRMDYGVWLPIESDIWTLLLCLLFVFLLVFRGGVSLFFFLNPPLPPVPMVFIWFPFIRARKSPKRAANLNTSGASPASTGLMHFREMDIGKEKSPVVVAANRIKTFILFDFICFSICVQSPFFFIYWHVPPVPRRRLDSSVGFAAHMNSPPNLKNNQIDGRHV